MRKRRPIRPNSGSGEELPGSGDGIDAYYEPWNAAWLELYRKETLRKIADGDFHSVELAIDFAVADPFSSGSGYVKSELFKFLARADLNAGRRRRLLNGIVHAIPAHRGDGWNHYCRLAGAFADAEFLKAVRAYVDNTDSSVARRAQHLLIRAMFPRSRPLRTPRW